LKVIIDTGPWSEFFRHRQGKRPAEAEEVARLIRGDAAQMLGPIRQELLSGARPDERFAQLREYLRFFPNLRLDETDNEMAAEYYNMCRANGIQGTGTDLLICAAATRYGIKIFTLDKDFDAYATVVRIQLHRIGGRIAGR
jgi:predicted nucleic acid-binding protein